MGGFHEPGTEDVRMSIVRCTTYQSETSKPIYVSCCLLQLWKRNAFEFGNSVCETKFIELVGHVRHMYVRYFLIRTLI